MWSLVSFALLFLVWKLSKYCIDEARTCCSTVRACWSYTRIEAHPRCGSCQDGYNTRDRNGISGDSGKVYLGVTVVVVEEEERGQRQNYLETWDYR